MAAHDLLREALMLELPSEYSRLHDPASGLVLHRMTSHPSINHATYFLASSFSPGGATLLFISNRSAAWQLYAITPFPDGPIRQLTYGPPIHPFSPVFHPDGDRVFFVRDGAVWAIEHRTGVESRVAGFEGAQMGECSLDAAGDWVVAAIKMDAQSGLAVGRSDGSAWSIIPFPRTIIHPQFHPVEHEWIEFAADPAPRMHRVRRDGTSLECLYEHGNDEFVVHEIFLGQTGDLVYTVWPRSLRVMDWTTRQHRTIRDCNAWHITPNRAGTKILCDTNHPDLGIFLIDVLSGDQEFVCHSMSSNQGSQWRLSRYALKADFEAAQSAAKGGALSWMEVGTDTVYGPQWTHPHPSFSPGESKVVFSSDRSGQPQVYVVEL